MISPDQGLDALRQIKVDFDAFCKANGAVTEADTRAKVIDRVLKEVLGWPEDAVTREPHVERGYIDYCVSLRGRRFIAVEAKREGIPFSLPASTHKSLKISGTLSTNPEVKEAIGQVRGYCDDAGIRYAIATNGYSWIVFRAIREDMPWKDGNARLFPSLEYIVEHFTEFWNLLSYEAVAGGSLDTEFGTPHRTPRNLLRVVDRLFNSDLPLQRNRLHTQLHPLLKAIFEDIADQDQLEILQSCYVHNDSLRIVATDLDCVIQDAIPKFLADQGTEQIVQNQKDSGRFGIALSGALNAEVGQLFLLLGGIGSGKTTFTKRYQKTVGTETLNKHSIWFHIDFLIAPVDPAKMELHVWQTILDQLRTRYSSPHLETRQNIKRVFAAEITAIEATALSGLRPGNMDYEKMLSSHLEEWQTDISRYVPGLLKLCKPRRDISIVLFVDNVDQLSPAYQSQIFLLAQRITRTIGATTIVAMREESYYTANIQKTFTAYTNRKFHIASPRFRTLISSRIDYALKILAKKDELPKLAMAQGLTLDRDAISDFLKIVQHSIFTVNKNIARFIEALCFGNMRLALQMFTTFLTSGATDVDKMLYIYRRDKAYFVAFHEFVKSIMLGERRYYKETQSPILNVFDCGSQKNASHFTALRIVNLLLSHRGESTPEGQGYIEVAGAAAMFEDVFDNREDFVRTMNRLVAKQLIEVNTRSIENITGASHARVTSAGWYYSRFLTRSFSYLDLVLQDTPLNDGNVEENLRNAVHQVDNLADREDVKVARMKVRLDRATDFLKYLKAEEDAEFKRFDLARIDSLITTPIVPEISAALASEREWIERRLRENREKFAEEPATVTGAETPMVEIDGEEDAKGGSPRAEEPPK